MLRNNIVTGVFGINEYAEILVIASGDHATPDDRLVLDNVVIDGKERSVYKTPVVPGGKYVDDALKVIGLGQNKDRKPVHTDRVVVEIIDNRVNHIYGMDRKDGYTRYAAGLYRECDIKPDYSRETQEWMVDGELSILHVVSSNDEPGRSMSVIDETFNTFEKAEKAKMNATITEPDEEDHSYSIQPGM